MFAHCLSDAVPDRAYQHTDGHESQERGKGKRFAGSLLSAEDPPMNNRIHQRSVEEREEVDGRMGRRLLRTWPFHGSGPVYPEGTRGPADPTQLRAQLWLVHR